MCSFRIQLKCYADIFVTIQMIDSNMNLQVNVQGIYMYRNNRINLILHENDPILSFSSFLPRYYTSFIIVISYYDVQFNMDICNRIMSVFSFDLKTFQN